MKIPIPGTRFIVDGEDVGVVVASVFVEEDVFEGPTKVTFPSEGYVFWLGFRDVLKSYLS